MAGTEKLEECKQYLRAQPSDGGLSLYDHMTQVGLWSCRPPLTQRRRLAATTAIIIAAADHIS